MGIRQTFTRAGGVLTSKLHQELSSFGVEGIAHLATGDVAVDFVSTPTAQDLLDVQAIIDAHDETNYNALVKSGAKTQFTNVPNWSTWNETTALAWFDANVSTAADGLPVLRAMVRMLIALRNDTWPDLQE